MRRNVWFMLGMLIGVTATMVWWARSEPMHARWEPPRLERKYPLRPALSFVIKSAWAAERPACYGHTSDFRASATKFHFFKLHPCPGGPDEGSLKRCHGYVIDHICPLECCGKDDPANMQWQTIEDGKAKDRWEGDCKRSCG